MKIDTCPHCKKKVAINRMSDELIFRSADRIDACDAAKWCARTAKPGDRREIAPDITMEVADG